jgi:hypothetical protein
MIIRIQFKWSQVKCLYIWRVQTLNNWTVHCLLPRSSKPWVYERKEALHLNSPQIKHSIHKLNKYRYVGFEVFTAVVMKSSIFWDVTRYSLLKCNRRFGGTYRLHLQGRRKFQQAGSCWNSSDTSVASQQTTRRHIPEVNTLQISGCLPFCCCSWSSVGCFDPFDARIYLTTNYRRK